MILVDSTIWIDHLRAQDSRLSDLIAGEQVVMHPLVLGEIAMGSLKDRENLLNRLAILPMAPSVRDAAVMLLVDSAKLFSTGLSFIDAHLLASTRMLPGCFFWTRDKRLHAQAERIGVAYKP